ncbi:MAG: tetratricopeptide repeat protein [Planctomycetes bacterium ADurb.Bin126]|nr:MAG: tetratricopeptide repeat protein [Planctomycetes bacterium ADurb.Bin126]
MGSLNKTGNFAPAKTGMSLRRAVCVLLLAALAGCQSPNIQTQRKEAYGRWNTNRAKMLYGMASEHLKNGQLDKAQIRIREALALDGEFMEARLLLGKVYIEQGFYDQAVGQIQSVVKTHPDVGEAVFLLAVAQEKNKQLDLALENYHKAYALDDRNPTAVTSAAEVLVQLGRVEEAQRHVESYLSTLKDDPTIHEIAGRLALMAGQTHKAVEYYRRAQNLDHQNIPYRESLARAYFYDGQLAKAEQTLTSMLEMKGFTPSLWYHAMLGECYLGLNRPRDAKRAFEAATQLKPSDADAWSNLAKAMLVYGDLERSSLSARQALDLEPAHLEATLTLGYVMVRKGQAEQAVPMLRQAVRAHPDNGMLLLVLGRALAQSGNRVQAEECYAQAVRLDPQNQAARELLAALRSQEMQTN